MAELHAYRVLDETIGVVCQSRSLSKIVTAVWGALRTGATGPTRRFVVRDELPARVLIETPDEQVFTCHSTGEFIHVLEREVVLLLQRACPERYFVHAGVVVRNDRAVLLIAESGQGKSTTTWGLLHHGFRYVSDELAPVRIADLTVAPYTRAISLKRDLPRPYHVPRQTVASSHTLHIPVRALPCHCEPCDHVLGTLLFLSYSPENRQPVIRPLTPGEASARLYANTLNQLAHTNQGLSGAAVLAQAIPGYHVVAADLSATCDLIRSTVDEQMQLTAH